MMPQQQLLTTVQPAAMHTRQVRRHRSHGTRAQYCARFKQYVKMMANKSTMAGSALHRTKNSLAVQHRVGR